MSCHCVHVNKYTMCTVYICSIHAHDIHSFCPTNAHTMPDSNIYSDYM
jgi:hypothetical protein